MAKLQWTRERSKSGPGDTLNGRWEVRRMAELPPRWGVYDRTYVSASSNGQAGNRYGYPTMRDARRVAEDFAIVNQKG